MSGVASVPSGFGDIIYPCFEKMEKWAKSGQKITEESGNRSKIEVYFFLFVKTKNLN